MPDSTRFKPMNGAWSAPKPPDVIHTAISSRNPSRHAHVARTRFMTSAARSPNDSSCPVRTAGCSAQPFLNATSGSDRVRYRTHLHRQDPTEALRVRTRGVHLPELVVLDQHQIRLPLTQQLERRRVALLRDLLELLQPHQSAAVVAVPLPVLV